MAPLVFRGSATAAVRSSVYLGSQVVLGLPATPPGEVISEPDKESPGSKPHMAVSVNWGPCFGCAYIVRALLWWNPYWGPLIFENSHMTGSP